MGGDSVGCQKKESTLGGGGYIRKNIKGGRYGPNGFTETPPRPCGINVKPAENRGLFSCGGGWWCGVVVCASVWLLLW